MEEIFQKYIKALSKYNVFEGTEHTLRPALDTLLKAVAEKSNPKIDVIHEPKRDSAGRGSPDFKVKINEAIIGYVENKKIEQNINETLKSEQIKKYQKLSDNILITNYHQWVWLKNGLVTKTVKFCNQDKIGTNKTFYNTEAAGSLLKLLQQFFSIPPVGIGNAKQLAHAMAIRCHDLKEFLYEELERQEKESRQARLYGLYEAFKTTVTPELKLENFSDAFAQMLGFGLFLAKLNAENKTISLSNAKEFIPHSFELIRELVSFLEVLNQEMYKDIKWLVEEILSIMNSLQLDNLKQDLAFKKDLFWENEEYRLFAKDPYVYFYEDFLKEYDSEMRKGRGVYYTPPPVVNFIVRAINDILKKDFKIEEGLADHKRVTVLDFAIGTGTFLLEILNQIFDSVEDDQKAIRDLLVKEHALKNLFGFEYLIAPYTIAHLKLSQFLKDKGYIFQEKDKFQIYLTNTLEPAEPQMNYLLPALSKEGQLAQNVKEKPVLVITGNPPYSGSSKNKGDWIRSLLKGIDKSNPHKPLKCENYFEIDGKPLGEKKTWLDDDYVKFIRFAQWKMEQVEEGIVGIITNHSFLDNPTFRGMRQSLMSTFDKIYILDLHGNTKKKETTPEGAKDENVFDIEQGVAISIFVKKKGIKGGISHHDKWGKRIEKYHFCSEQKLKT